MNDIYLALANEDARDAARGKLPVQHEVHPGAFLQLGLDLEEQQYVIPAIALVLY